MLSPYRVNPTVPRGYELDQIHMGIIVPEATTNLLPNPSVENDLTDWVAFGTATLARSAAWAWAGVYGVAVTGIAANSGPAYFLTSGAIVATTIYAGSARFRGQAGKTYQLRVATTSATLSDPVVATGDDQEISVIHVADGSTNASMALIQNQPGGTFYTDAWQLEALDHPTTYVDGDRRGFVRGQAAYAWTGAPHASTSTRSAQTRAGGRILMFSALGFRLLSLIGLAMLPLSVVATPLASGGGFYQTTIPGQARDFMLVGDVYGGTLRQLQAQKAELLAALNPFLTTVRQPLVLVHQTVDGYDRPISRSVQIVAHYTGGMEGVTDNYHQERMSCAFRMFLPNVQRQADSAAILDPVQDLATAGIVQRSSAGIWQALESGVAGGTVLALAPAGAGGVYVGGSFDDADGETNTARIAHWTGTAFESLGTGGVDPGGFVYALAVAPDGSLVAAGSFASMGGAANTAALAAWDGSAWSSIASAISVGGEIYAAAFGPDGTLYVAGQFTSVGGVAAANVARRSPAGVWSALGSGLNGIGYSLLSSQDGGIYVGGGFTTANGVSTPGGVARWNGTTFAALGTGLGVGATAYALAETSAGLLYAGGDSSDYDNIAVWNGTIWAGVGGGQIAEARALAVDSAGQIYVAGGGGGGLTSPAYTVWTGTSWMPSEIASSSTNTAAILVQADGTLTLGGDYASPITTAGSTSVTNNGTADAAPTIRLTGPAPGSPAAFVYAVANMTTGATIAFDDLHISAGEIITLTLDPQQISMVSSFQGNVIGKMIPGSNVAGMALQPGVNVINVYISDAAAGATMTWRDQYLALEDGLIR